MTLLYKVMLSWQQIGERVSNIYVRGKDDSNTWPDCLFIAGILIKSGPEAIVQIQ